MQYTQHRQVSAIAVQISRLRADYNRFRDFPSSNSSLHLFLFIVPYKKQLRMLSTNGCPRASLSHLRGSRTASEHAPRARLAVALAPAPRMALARCLTCSRQR